ncbi:hypothetical protein L7F22_037744 [Adiantum nelumboides]|nr:hypothetical protein [Adiantum nelumboides]
MADKAKKAGGEGMRDAYSTPPPKEGGSSVARAGRVAKRSPAMRATWSRVGPTSIEVGVQVVRGVKRVPVEVKEVKGDDVLAASQQGLSPWMLQKHVQALEIATHSDQGVPSLAVVAPELCQGTLAMVDVALEPCQGGQPSSCKLATVTKGRKKKAPKAQQRAQVATLQALKIAMHSDQDAPPMGLKIATHLGQDAPLSTDVPREPCQGATLKKAPKAPKPPKEAQPTKQDLIVFEGSGALKAQKSGQAKEVSGTASTEPPKTHLNKRKANTDVKEKEGTAVPEQHNVKKLKKMKEVGVREVAIEQKLAIDELEKGSEDKIGAKRDGMKKKAKKHVEKGLEDKEPADKALALVGSSKRPKLQHDDAGDDDGGSDVSGGGDDNADGENDGIDDEDDGGGSDEGNSEGVIEQNDTQNVSTREDEVQEILSSLANFLA